MMEFKRRMQFAKNNVWVMSVSIVSAASSLAKEAPCTINDSLKTTLQESLVRFFPANYPEAPYKHNFDHENEK